MVAGRQAHSLGAAELRSAPRHATQGFRCSEGPQHKCAYSCRLPAVSDFHQNGLVTSLPRLRDRPLEELENHILRLSPKFPVSLVLPMVPDEMDRPALARIRDELREIRYLDSLVVSLNRATADDYARTVEYLQTLSGAAGHRVEREPGDSALLRATRAGGSQSRDARERSRVLAGDGLPIGRRKG